MQEVNVMNIVNDPMILLEYIYQDKIFTKDDGKRVFLENVKSGTKDAMTVVTMHDIHGVKVPEISYVRKVPTEIAIPKTARRKGIGDTLFEVSKEYEFPFIELPSRIATRILNVQKRSGNIQYRIAEPKKQKPDKTEPVEIPKGYKRGKFGRLVKVE